MITIDAIIADALRRYLATRLRTRTAARAFFRISGFSPAAYAALLDALAAQSWQIEGVVIEARSIELITGHADRIKDPLLTATWYRNRVGRSQALLLIQNGPSSDAQSLQNLFSVTEITLSNDGLPQLIDAAFTRYQLVADERELVSKFVRRLAKVLFEPQLRDLAEFLIAVDETLHAKPGTAVEHAVALALPHLGLFRCREIERQIGTPRADKLLRQLREASRIGGEVLDERARGDYLRRLAEARFDDDGAIGGLTDGQKRELLRDFVEGRLRNDHARLLQVLGIDWREIQLVITAKSRITRQERLGRAATQLETVLGQESPPTEAVAEVLADLRAGREPDGDLMERALAEQGDSLPPAVRNELRRLVKPRTRKRADFLAGLTELAVELLHPLQAELRPGTRLVVTPNLAAASDSSRLPEALAAFRALFGGIERALPSVGWQLDELWQKLDSPTRPDDDDQERDRNGRLELPFRITVLGPDNVELTRAELIWQYRSDSPAAATALTLAAEHAQLAPIAGPLFAAAAHLRVPVFNTCPSREEIGDLDIHRPIQSLGAWFDQPGDLRTLLFAALQRRARPHAETALNEALARLEGAWATFVGTAAPHGMLAADSGALVEAYAGMLHTAAANLQTSGEATAYWTLNQAWIIGPQHFDRWAVMPLLHPLKLLWWRERARYFSQVIARLLDPAQQVQIVDEPRYRRELAATYGSSSFPPVLALPPGEGRPAERFLPVEEADGYELFFRERQGGEPFGLDAETLADDEARIATERAVEGIAAVVQDYLETYPFVRDGLEIVLFECRNSALPGLLAERLARASAAHGWPLRLSVIVHTSDRGAPIFRRVSEWLAAEQLVKRRRADYFPPVSLKVLQCPVEELLHTREDNDIVILADVLAERGQRVLSQLVEAEADAPAAGYLPTYQAQQEPFPAGEVYRRLLLSHPQQPAVARLFLLAQHAAVDRRPVNSDQAARFFRELTLLEWERDLGRLHDHFNWVICYDPTVDRFLLQSAFPDKVQVIRYSLGLGAKRQHNLTVSSSHKAQAIVERRLAGRLGQMLPNASQSFLSLVAARLVAHAKQISGDIVLRAAGPGALLNELIGLVAAKFETERRARADAPDALTAWILLDDFEHWFGGGKFPDLLFVAISRSANGELLLHLKILEAKCVSQPAFAVEAADAEEQVRRGVSRLARAFASGYTHLDALFWYDQLYRAVAGNLTLELEQQPLWELFRERLHTGAFVATVEGHAWAFCYNAQVAGVGAGEYPSSKPAPGAPEVPIRAHHYGRNELCQMLRELIAADGGDTNPEMWQLLKQLDGETPKSEAEHPAEGITNQAPEALRSASMNGEQREQDDRAFSLTAHTPPHQPCQPTPSLSLHAPPAIEERNERQWLIDKAHNLERALRQRGVQIMPIDPAQADIGPSIVRFKLRLRPNESLRKIQGVAEDLARDLALASTPIIDNVLRTNFVGVDIPREQAQVIELRPLLENLGTPDPAELPIVIGVTPDGALVTEDLSEFPHLLVAGATNSGKSVFLRSMLLSLMTQYRAGRLELLIVDPKRTDFTFFNSMPYLRGGKVIVERGEARDALLELVRAEMPRRQDLIANRSMKVKLFNQRYPDEALPPIVALIDEYALLVSMMDKKERESFEQDLMILAAAARSVGIHLVLATQRPSADIVTSTLKANLDARIAFRVASSTNARVVLDTSGAENLLGRGDMLFRRPSGEIIRLQAPFMGEEQMQAYLAALVTTATQQHSTQG
jgi:hypothetical protein